MIFDNSRRQNNLREALAVVGLIALSFLLLTLLTWSPKDPSFSNNEETKNIANLGGTFGAPHRRPSIRALRPKRLSAMRHPPALRSRPHLPPEPRIGA